MQFLKVFIRRQLSSLNLANETRNFTDVVVSLVRRRGGGGGGWGPPPPPPPPPPPLNTTLKHTHTNVLLKFREVVEQYIFARFGQIAFKRGIRFPNFMELLPAVSMYEYSLTGLH